MTNFNYSLSLQAAAFIAFPFAYPFFTRSTEAKMLLFSGRPPQQPPGLRRLIAMQVMLPINGLLQRKVKQLFSEKPLHLKERMAIAYFSGTATVVASNPFEVALVKAQREGISIFNATKILFQQRGASAFFSGSLLASVRHSIFITHLFAVYPHIHERLNIYRQGNSLAEKMGFAFASAIAPAFLSCTLTQPLDVIIFARQLEAGGRWREIAKKVMQLKGLAGFWVGYPHRLMGTSIQMAIFNAALVCLQWEGTQ